MSLYHLTEVFTCMLVCVMQKVTQCQKGAGHLCILLGLRWREAVWPINHLRLCKMNLLFGDGELLGEKLRATGCAKVPRWWPKVSEGMWLRLVSLKRSTGPHCFSLCGFDSERYQPALSVSDHPPVTRSSRKSRSSLEQQRKEQNASVWSSEGDGQWAWMACCSYSRNVEIAVKSLTLHHPRLLLVPSAYTHNRLQQLGFS